MTELLTFVADYRTLLGRSVLGMQVSDADLRRLGALEQFLAEPANLPASRRRNSRVSVYFPGTMRIGDHVIRLSITDLSAGGLGALTPVPLSTGALGIIEIRDPDTQTQYRMPVRVAWTTTYGRAGLTFLGVPVELRRNSSARSGSRDSVIEPAPGVSAQIAELDAESERLDVSLGLDYA